MEKARQTTDFVNATTACADLQECELCHDEFPLRDVELSDSGQILCKKCRSAEPPNASS